MSKIAGKPFTRKQLGIIFKIAFLEAMALSIIVPTIQSSGEIPVPDKQLIEKGTTTAFSIPGGGISGSTSITFPKAFSTPPNITLTQLSTIVNPINIADEISIVASGTSVTWSGMPALQTELFGNTNNRARLNDQNPINMWFAVNVLTAGTGTATLRVQTSGDQITWVDPCSTPGTADLSISATGLIVTSCQVNPGLNSFMRIIGFNGNGIVSPVFGLITVTFINTEQLILTLVPLAITKTGFIIFGNLNFRAGSAVSPTIQWIAIECQASTDEKVGSC